jgi:hypothetical protein
MYILIFHDKSITTAKLPSEHNWKPVMMRVINIIYMIGDFIITFLIGCGCLALPCIIKESCSESKKDNIDISYLSNTVIPKPTNTTDITNDNVDSMA